MRLVKHAGSRPHPRLWFRGSRVGAGDLILISMKVIFLEAGGPQGSLRKTLPWCNNHLLQLGQLRLRERFKLQ